jgi:multisubunit Na+/H+ antiporter MnhG subunit
MFEQLSAYLPFLIPVAVIQVGLMLAAIIHIIKHDNFRFGNKVIWILVCVFINIVGPVLYFVIGRDDNAED